MKQCVIYTRVSTDLQEYSSQIRELEEFAKKNDYVIAKPFSEKKSGYKEGIEREQYELMKEFVYSNDIKTILVWEISRIGRRMDKLVGEITEFANRGINIHSIKGPISDTMIEGKLNYLLVGVISAMVEMERDTIRDRIARGVRNSALKGSRSGLATVPYGYKTENSLIVIDKKEAKIVKDIFAMFIKGIPIRQICHTLNSKNIPTRNQTLGYTQINKHTSRNIQYSWQPSTINGIVRNPFYKGERKFNDEIIPSPIIIDKEEWEKAQERKGQKIGYRTKPTKHSYLIKNALECGMCGSRFNVFTRNRPTGLYRTYACADNNNVAHPCNNGLLGVDKIDKAVYNMMIQHKDLYLNLKEEEIKKFNPKEKEGQILYYQGELKDLEKKRNRVIKLFRDGYYTEKEFEKEQANIKIASNEATYQIQKLKNELKEFNKNAGEKPNIKAIHENWKAKNFNEKKYLIDKYLDRVVVYKVNLLDITKDQVNKTKMAPFRKERLNIYIDKIPGNTIHYIEIFVFGNSKPIKMLFYNYHNETFFTDKFQYKNGVITMTD